MKKEETVLVAQVFYVRAGSDQQTADGIEYLYSCRYKNDTGYKSTVKKATILGYTRQVGEFVPTPIASLKRKVALHSSTFIPDPRNKAGVGNLHRSRISTRVVPLAAKYCDEDGNFVQEW